MGNMELFLLAGKIIYMRFQIEIKKCIVNVKQFLLSLPYPLMTVMARLLIFQRCKLGSTLAFFKWVF